ncbi:Alpha/Beta hydrolase protein [Neurospora intermedia]|uniref:Alpha/Beta hydrolase protein n=1 Tax=Neurospora intermedia TaxID=5142 RepID=A0ABR3DD79_NEUIN
MPSPLRRPVHDGVRLGTTSRVDHQTLDSDVAVSVNSVENGEPQRPTLIPGWGSPGTTQSTPLVASSTARASGDTESSGSSTPTSLSLPPPPHLPLLQDEKPRYVRRPPGLIKSLSKKIMFCSAWVFVIGFLCVCLYNYRYNANGLIPSFAPSDVGVPSMEKGTPSSTTQHGNYGDSNDNGEANSSDSTEAIVSYVDPDLELGLSSASSPSVPTPTSQTADTKDTSYSPSTTLMTATITMTNERQPGATATSPAVTLRQGRYIGIHLSVDYRFPKAIEAFRGVPFAQTTGGENRFRPPKALPDSDQTFQAGKFGENCPIGGTVGNGFGENCLNANIYRPAGLVDDDGLKIGDSNKRPALLPVVVYIHGGAFNGGMGSERNMASFVSWADAPMIGINFNYRVGALGFLPSALTAKEGLLNLGLRDQTMLLEWVRENVKAFGGDPDNVTIMGLSAGAHSIGHHIIYYARKESAAPFHRAILESGATTARAVLLPNHPRHLVQFREFLAAAGVDGLPDDQIFDHLRKLPLETIVRASKKVWDRYEPSVTWPFQPVIDGLHDQQQAISNSNSEVTPVLIPDLPITSWRQGKHLRIPVLTGFNTNEGAMFIPRQANTNDDFRSFFKTLIPTLTDADLAALENLYPDPVTNPHSSNNPYRSVPVGMGAQWARLDAAYSHYAYICPVLQTAHFMSQAGLPVHVYRFAARGNWDVANHADEAPVVAHDMDFFRSFGPPRRSKGLRKVADGMNAAWGRFINGEKVIEVETDGKKGSGKRVVWPLFKTPFGDGDLELDRGGAGHKTAERNTERRWSSSSSLWKHSSSGDDDVKPPEGTGRMIVFGEGNNERAGASSPGTPAKEEVLNEILLKACRFWWDRIELSEGLGTRREEMGRSGKGTKARL